VLGKWHAGLGVDDGVLGEHTGWQRVRRIGPRWPGPTRDPVRLVNSGDAVAGFHTPHPRADADYLTRGIRKRDERQCGTSVGAPFDHHQVHVVERYRADAQEHVTSFGVGCFDLDLLQ
jgi:hypothetical protein